MFPAFCLEHLAGSVRADQPHGFFACYPADARDSKPVNFWRYGPGGCEEELVVVASVQGKIKTNEVFFCAGRARTGKGSGCYLRSDPALLADMLEVGRKAVANVDHSGWKLVPA